MTEIIAVLSNPESYVVSVRRGEIFIEHAN